MTKRKENKMSKSTKKTKMLSPKLWKAGCPEEIEYLEWRKNKLENGSKHN